MGLRMRKSINLGGGARINLSKSGVGFSFGTKGARITKTAKGTTRTTLGIPGTGLSYVKETGHRKKKSSRSQASGTGTPSGNNHPKNQKGSSGKKVWAWVLTVFLATGVLAFFPHFTSWLLLAATALSVPPLKDFWGKYLKGSLKTVLIVVLFLLSMMVAPPSEAPEQPVSPETSVPTIPTTIPTEAPTSAPTAAAKEETTEPVPSDPPATAPVVIVPGVVDNGGYFDLDETYTEPTTEPSTVPVDPPPVFTESSVEENYRDYVVNTNTGKFHFPSCRSAQKIKSENRWDFYGSRDDLISQGYQPCGQCHP